MKNSTDRMDAVPRRRKAADMYLKGWSQETIASFLEDAGRIPAVHAEDAELAEAASGEEPEHVVISN